MEATSYVCVYDRMQDPIAAIDKMGDWIFKSRMFGCDERELGGDAQARIFALACLQERKSPLEMLKTYHIIQGKLAKRADAMLGEYDDHPACAGAQATYARLMAIGIPDMPPSLDDLALLLEAASQRLGGVGHAAVWTSIGVGRDRGRNFLSPRGIGAVDWPIWSTLREA